MSTANTTGAEHRHIGRRWKELHASPYNTYRKRQIPESSGEWLLYGNTRERKGRLGIDESRGVRHVLKKQVGLSLIGWRVVYFCAFSCGISCFSILLHPSLCPFKKEAGSDRLKSKPPSWIIPEYAKKAMGVDEAH
ncbi:hypothetical protein HMPREF9141_1658 [Prevotella multiformis DSM 16608]|uniref:Uncharacterized protein n=2 Tax=Prevotella multiformis TaxID=282402 RepID=F0F7U1_9BACT|nr:hypothetical protein HMPREF9141_1658 [Prevotella multiformis DSM 16608]